jgi:hypothetical protein
MDEQSYRHLVYVAKQRTVSATHNRRRHNITHSILKTVRTFPVTAYVIS